MTRYLFAIVTDRVGDIFWTLNQAGIHLYDQGKRALKVELETVTPNFQRFETAVDAGKWRDTGSVFVWELHQGQNTLRARSINKWGLPRRGA
jgi:hypothetical protein